MKISLKSVSRKYDESTINSSFGPDDTSNKKSFDYNRTAMNLLLFIFAASMIVSQISIVLAEDIPEKLFGLFWFLLCGYGLIVLLREKSNLELISQSFDSLSGSAKQELISSILESQSISSSKFLDLLESMLNKIVPGSD